MSKIEFYINGVKTPVVEKPFGTYTMTFNQSKYRLPRKLKKRLKKKMLNTVKIIVT